MDQPTWILYVKSGCPWCIDAVGYLNERGYRYQEVDVSRDRAAFAKMQEVSGQTRAPTLQIGEDLVLADFDNRQLETFLTKHGLKA